MPAGVSAWTPLANLTLAANQTSVTFSSISGSYRDLMLVVSAKWSVTNSSTAPSIEFNSDTTDANYWFVDMNGNGSTTSSVANNWRGINSNGFGFGNPAPQFQIVCQFLDYSATDKHKVYLNRINDASFLSTASAARWANTAAITSLTFKAALAFAAGSTFALYGVSA